MVTDVEKVCGKVLIRRSSTKSSGWTTIQGCVRGQHGRDQGQGSSRPRPRPEVFKAKAKARGLRDRGQGQIISEFKAIYAYLKSYKTSEAPEVLGGFSTGIHFCNKFKSMAKTN